MTLESISHGTAGENSIHIGKWVFGIFDLGAICKGSSSCFPPAPFAPPAIAIGFAAGGRDLGAFSWRWQE
jgi:hypothetical protein